MTKWRSLALSLLAISTLPACQQTPPKPPVATPAFVGLAGTNWRLVEFQSMDDAQGTQKPADPDKYTITFHNDGSLTARLDCNRAVGPWRNDSASSTEGTLSIGPLAVTKAYCAAPSMGELLERQLGFVRSFIATGNRLKMALMADAGIIVWEAKPY